MSVVCGKGIRAGGGVDKPDTTCAVVSAGALRCAVNAAPTALCVGGCRCAPAAEVRLHEGGGAGVAAHLGLQLAPFAIWAVNGPPCLQ